MERSRRLDELRGALVLAMVAYHACYVAVMFGFSSIDLYGGFWWVFPRLIAAGFVGVSGWCLAAKKAGGASFRAFARRSGRLALVALAISAATYPVLRERFVFFGVIHLLALASIAAYPLLGRPVAALAVAALCMAGGLALGEARFAFPWLAWLGLRPATLFPADYLPFLPWFAFAALGAAAYDLCARRAKARPKARATKARPQKRYKPGQPGGPGLVERALSAAGRHSLAVYLIHLPALFLLGLAASWLAA